jgi:hypothetical protein
VACPLTQLSMGCCKAHATPLPPPDAHGNSLSRKAHRPRGSVEGQPRAYMAVLMGSQLPVGWHVQRRIRARIAMTSRDGTVAEHSLAVRQCRGLVEGGKRREKGARQWGAGHATCRAVLRGSAGALGITEDVRHRWRRQEGVAQGSSAGSDCASWRIVARLRSRR